MNAAITVATTGITQTVASTYEILKSYIENGDKGNMAIIATYNELYKVQKKIIDDKSRRIADALMEKMTPLIMKNSAQK